MIQQYASRRQQPQQHATPPAGGGAPFARNPSHHNLAPLAAPTAAAAIFGISYVQQQQHQQQQRQQQQQADPMQVDLPQHQQPAAAAAPINPPLLPPVAPQLGGIAPEALLDAVSEGRIEMVQSLIRSDPELANHRDGFGQTPLMWAAYKGRADMVDCLLDCGAAINECETRRARTALYLACEFDHADVVALLLKRGANQRLPAQRGWTVLSRGFDGWTPLIIAGYNGCPSVLKCLLAHGEADLDGGDEKGATALWWAAVHNRPDAVRVLLDAGADFGLCNDEGKTPCEAARERGNHECASLLEAAERAYLMTKSRRVSRESEVLAKMAAELVAAAPSYLKHRISQSMGGLPRLHDEISPELQTLMATAEAEAELMELNTGRAWKQVAAFNGKLGPPTLLARRKMVMMPDAGDEEQNVRTLPAISHYVSKQMRYDVFVQFRELMD